MTSSKPSALSQLLLYAIRAYQRFLSPHKGFSCAYRIHTGRASCSNLGFRAVRRYGALAGIAILLNRTNRCGDIHRQLTPKRPFTYQRGECDFGCDGCDLPSGKTLANCCEFADCCSCDWPRRKRKNDLSNSTPAHKPLRNR